MPRLPWPEASQSDREDIDVQRQQLEDSLCALHANRATSASIPPGADPEDFITMEMVTGDDSSAVWIGKLGSHVDTSADSVMSRAHSLMWDCIHRLPLPKGVHVRAAEDPDLQREQLLSSVDGTSAARVAALWEQKWGFAAVRLTGPLAQELARSGACYRVIGCASNMRNKIRAARLTLCAVFFRPDALLQDSEWQHEWNALLQLVRWPRPAPLLALTDSTPRAPLYLWPR